VRSNRYTTYSRMGKRKVSVRVWRPELDATRSHSFIVGSAPGGISAEAGVLELPDDGGWRVRVRREVVGGVGRCGECGCVRRRPDVGRDARKGGGGA
jgi:hypothetical protein